MSGVKHQLGGAGDDMRKFLEAQQEDAEGEEVKIGEDAAPKRV